MLDTNALISGFIYPASIPGHIVGAWREARSEWVMSKEQPTEIARCARLSKDCANPTLEARPDRTALETDLPALGYGRDRSGRCYRITAES